MKLLTLIASLIPLISQAFPVVYTYTGSNYTQHNVPWVPGLSPLDHVYIKMTMDSKDWGTVNPYGVTGTIISGPYVFEASITRVATDTKGNILAWGFYGDSHLEIVSGSELDGSGTDDIYGFMDLCDGHQYPVMASIEYLAGERNPAELWQLNIVK